MKAAGYPDCKYTGSEKVVIVGSNADPGPKEMQIVESGLQKLGFKTQIKAVPQQTMYSKFCGNTEGGVQRLPDRRLDRGLPGSVRLPLRAVQWQGDRPGEQRNWAQLDDPEINKAMDAAAQVTDPAQRRKAWADVNKMLVEAAPAIPEVWGVERAGQGQDGEGRPRPVERRLEPVVQLARSRNGDPSEMMR